MAGLVLGALLVAGCDRAPGGTPGASSSNPLESAARERGIVETATVPPTGVFERRHDLGRDAMCIVPDGDAYRFALTAGYGPGLSCEAEGTLTVDDGQWTMRFAGAGDCIATVREEEDEVRLPGTLPESCAALCPSKASLSGLRLPRASWTAGDARTTPMPGKGDMPVYPCR